MENSIRFRSGCMVCWYTFATEDEAKAASEIAKVEARKAAAQGYDFGYCSPGSITKVSWHTLDGEAVYRYEEQYNGNPPAEKIFKAGTEVWVDKTTGKLDTFERWVPVNPDSPTTKHEGWEVCFP